MMRIRLAVIMLTAIGLFLVVSCEEVPVEEEPGDDGPRSEVDNGREEPMAEEEEPMAEEEEEMAPEFQVTCEPLTLPEPGPKPALSLAGREPDLDPLTWNSERVIGFAFDGGSLGMVFSPASGVCVLDDPGLGQVAGIVYVARDPGQSSPEEENYWQILMVTVVPGTDIGYLIDENLVDLEQIDYDVALLEQIGEDPYPIDGAIRSNGLCVQMQDEDASYKRFCSSGNGRLSIRDVFGDAYDAQVAGLISEAEEVLLGEDVASQMPQEVITPLLEGEEPVRGLAISEVVSASYIGECSLESCPADIVVAPFELGPHSVAIMGILSVRQTLFDPDGVPILGFGKYVIHAEKDTLGEPILPLFVSGLEEEIGEVISFVEMPSSLASLVNPETNDAGEAAISGCKLWKVCFFWESRC